MKIILFLTMLSFGLAFMTSEAYSSETINKQAPSTKIVMKKFLTKQINSGENKQLKVVKVKKVFLQKLNKSYFNPLSVKSSGNCIFNTAVYPNPAGNTIKFQFSCEDETYIEVVIFDTGGSKILSFESMLKSGTNELLSDIAHFNAGTYFYNIKSGQSVHSGIFIVSK